MNRKKLLRVLPWITTPGLLILLFIIWEITVKALEVSPLILPPPSLIFESLGTVLGEASTWSHIRVTVIQILIGFSVGTFAGVVVGVLLALIHR
ncbi:hypothetical protein [Citricoccus sp. NR2]|uniref:hypothetical protein n=1 Tax=Citricoccus sp. NR2 TaxID=3004095 RepID=UPI0022DDE0F3|nr:hypothetical protein [Citricoccus sp. NR2]WBL19267.1 hypothetical protein O1A05_00720 [Citricoccus sp. NR2]